MKTIIYYDEAQDFTEQQLQDLLVLVRPKVFINDTRTTDAKLADLTDDSLLDRMQSGFTNFRRSTDPYGVMSDNWLWNRWIRTP